jgi:hypothetical protein
MVREIVSSKSAKIMLPLSNGYDEFWSGAVLIRTTFEEKSFKEIFSGIYSIAEELGLLWQTDTITPAHEHFISYLINKSISQYGKTSDVKPTKLDRFSLSIPMNEIHELGLMYLNYEILLSGYKTVYLGKVCPLIT